MHVRIVYKFNTIYRNGWKYVYAVITKLNKIFFSILF